MSVLFTFLAFLPPLAIGFLLVSVLWDRDRPILADLPLKCCLSVGFGFGSSSCLVFLWLMVVGRLTRGVLVCEFVLLLALSVWFFSQKRARISTTAGQMESTRVAAFGRPYLLGLAVCVAAVSAGIRFWFLSLQHPHGEFDAYAIWNLRARFLYRGGEYWKNFTHIINDHSDYPLLVPASIARSWELIGRETHVIPGAIGLLFTFATIGIVMFAMSRLRGQRQGLLAGLILLGTPFLIAHGASQYADVPLSFFFVATAALLLLYAESQSQTHLLILAGMAAAFSAWTKNEGLLFLVLLIFVHFLVTTGTKNWKSYRSEVVALLIGAAPVLVVILVYKIRLAASNDIMAAQGLQSTLPKLLNLARYRLVFGQFVRELFTFGEWHPIFAMPLVLFFYFLLLGASVKKKHVAATSMAVLLPISMMFGYFCVYIVSPAPDLRFHLESSLNRLFLQVWPLAVLAYFAIVQAPEQAVVANMNSSRIDELPRSGAFERDAG